MESKDQNWKRITELYTSTLTSMTVRFFSNHGQYKKDYQTQGQYINLTKWCNLEHELQREIEKHKIRQTLCPSLRTVLMLPSLLLLSLSWRFFPSNFPPKFFMYLTFLNWHMSHSHLMQCTNVYIQCVIHATLLFTVFHLAPHVPLTIYFIINIGFSSLL